MYAFMPSREVKVSQTSAHRAGITRETWAVAAMAKLLFLCPPVNAEAPQKASRRPRVRSEQDSLGAFFNGANDSADVQATYRQLSARGVEFTGGATKETWGTSATFKDVEGNESALSSR